MPTTIKPDNRYKTAQFIVLSILTLLGILIAGFIHILVQMNKPDPHAISVLWRVSLGILFSMWIISIPMIHLWIKNLQYIIHTDRVTIHKGILTKKKQNIPYRSVTDFILKRGPIDRVLGIGSIQIQTAGQSVSSTGYEGCLSGLLEFDSLHADLREKIKSLHPVSETPTNSESTEIIDNNILSQILDELKAIKENTQK